MTTFVKVTCVFAVEKDFNGPDTGTREQALEAVKGMRIEVPYDKFSHGLRITEVLPIRRVGKASSMGSICHGLQAKIQEILANQVLVGFVPVGWTMGGMVQSQQFDWNGKMTEQVVALDRMVSPEDLAVSLVNTAESAAVGREWAFCGQPAVEAVENCPTDDGGTVAIRIAAFADICFKAKP